METDVDEDETPSETKNSMQESDYPTEESKRKFIWESFKIDKNEIWRYIKIIIGKTDILGLKIELEAGAVPRRSRVRPLYSDQRAYLKEQLNKWIQKGVMEPTNSPWASPLVPVKKKDGRTRCVTDL